MKTENLYETPVVGMMEIDSAQVLALSYGNEGDAAQDLGEDYYYGSF